MAAAESLPLDGADTYRKEEGQPGVVTVVDAQEDTAPMDYKIYLAKTMGLSQIIIGTLCLVQSVCMAILSYNTLWLFTSGWWAWPFFIVSGSFGLASGSYPNNCTIITSMVMSIISCTSAAVSIAQMTVGLSMECWSCHGYNDTEAALHTVSYFSLVCWLFEFTVALIQSIITCPAVCCTGSKGHPQDKKQV